MVKEIVIEKNHPPTHFPENDKNFFIKYSPISGCEIWKAQSPLSTKVLWLWGERVR